MVIRKVFSLEQRAAKEIPDNHQQQEEDGLTGPATRGLSVVTTAVFVVGEVAGSGVLAFPLAFNNIGWIGLLVMLVCVYVSTYTGTLMGKCWMMVLERHAECRECREHARHPYPTIGQFAFGKTCGRLVSFCVDLTSFGSGVVFFLLASQNLSDLIGNLGVRWSPCFWLFIVAVVLCPVCWLGTPKDFWPIALGAALATTVACLIMLIQMVRDSKVVPPPFHAPFYWKSFLISFGTFFYGFGGHQEFLTFQVDMKRPEKFGYAMIIAYSIILAMYLPVSVAGFLVYGSNLQANVLMTILPGPLLSTAQILITLHLLTGIVIVINPVCQEGEELFKVPPYFCFRRVVFRTAMIGLVLFTALTLPQFGAIVALIGGSTMAAMIFIFPPLFYLRLCSMKGPWNTVPVSLHEKVACTEIMVVGALVGVASTYTALDALLNSQFTKPCYV